MRTGKRFDRLTQTDMGHVQFDEVFTVDELARATGASHERVASLAVMGDLHFIPGTRFIRADEAIRCGQRLRHDVLQTPLPPATLFAHPTGSLAHRRAGTPAIAATLFHLALLAAAAFMTARTVGTTATEQPIQEPVRLVFLATPGPGGGGGGGGRRTPLPPPRVEQRGTEFRRATVPAVTPAPVLTSARRDIAPPRRPAPPAAPIAAPKPAAREPDPLPSNILVAPVVASASDARNRDGLIERGQGDADSQGSGTGGGTGVGHGAGNGEGLGSGIGNGSGGGTGGGPYRPGSGIEPPRLLKEVKADYTEEARRRAISGEVLLEIVVRRDGSVGDVTILRGLGGGLDQRAVQAVGQWRFDPARRKGVPVDVLVEVAVEFMLR